MSFTKDKSKKIPGTKSSIQNSQLLISSGIPSLDHVIGGGLTVGSIFLIEEDLHANYSKVMLKYFLAEGVVCGHALLLASVNNDPEKIISELPPPTSGESETEHISLKSSEDMKIAWRYNDLSPVDSTLGPALKFGHFYDLSKKMDSEMLQNTSKKLWKASLNMSYTDCENSAYNNLLKCIKDEINTGNFTKSESSMNENILRIGIESLGSPFWQMYQKQTTNLDKDGNNLRKFLYCLRGLLRTACAVAFITIPTHLFENPDTVLHVRHLVDTAVRLDSFAGTERESNPVLRDYHGLFYLPKISAINTLVPYIPSTLDLAFKLRRKKFIIEKLHLPPELQDSSEREQDDNAVLGCGGSSKKLDF